MLDPPGPCPGSNKKTSIVDRHLNLCLYLETQFWISANCRDYYLNDFE